MAEQLRHAPWIALSIVIHVIAVLLIMMIPAERAVETQAALRMEKPPEDVVIEDEVPPVEKPVEEQPVEPTLQEDVVLQEAPAEEFTADFADVEVDVAPKWDTPVGLGGGHTGLRGSRREGRRKLGPGGHDKAVAILEGLEWLRRHQDEDGKWDADGFMKHDPASDVCEGPGNAVHDVGVTGLALLAFLGDGSDLRSGPYRDVVKKAVRWLREQQDDESGLFGSSASHDFIYDHAIAALAMTEAYGLSKARILRQNAQAGLNYLEAHRNPYMVWRYQPRDQENDTSITGWCLMAYKTGKDFDLQVNDRALDLCGVWIDSATDPITGRCGYTERGTPSSRRRGDHGTRFPTENGECLTAVGLLSRFFLGQDPETTPVMKQAADRLLAKPPVWDEGGSIDHYYWYYATYALFQMGGRHWSQWGKKLTHAVVNTRRTDGSHRGSWDPAGAWGEDGGRVYSTAILVLTLEAYYRYSRVFVR